MAPARLRIWFFLAAIYNAVWGALVGIWPNSVFQLLRMQPPDYPWLMQCIAMMVGVYAIGYWLVGRDPVRYGAFVFVGLAGKVLGPIGFLVCACQGQIPWRFGWLNVFNDLIWLPAFGLFAVAWVRNERVIGERSPCSS